MEQATRRHRRAPMRKWWGLPAVLVALAALAGGDLVGAGGASAGRSAVVAATGSGQATPTAGTEHVFALSDTGATLTVAVGDTVALRFGAVRGMSLSGPNPAILSPLPNSGSDNARFAATAPGTTTIDATGGPPCPGPICPAIAFVFQVTIVVAQTPSAAETVSYPAGWNLVSMPPTGRLPVDAFDWDATKETYARVAAGEALQPGRGYWAFFPDATTLTLPAATHDAVQFGGPEGAWLLAGNPNAAIPAAISGASVAFAWDATAQRYVPTTTLQPGSGAWVLSEGSSITVGACGTPRTPCGTLRLVSEGNSIAVGAAGSAAPR